MQIKARTLSFGINGILMSLLTASEPPKVLTVFMCNCVYKLA